MALRDVTADGVERAMAEFDRLGRESFLSHHGFGETRSYFLVHDGRRYDSTAVAGVAHGYSRPDLDPLRSQDFAGGEAPVARHLESLGFAVERPPRNPTWAEEERILALDLYLQSGLLDDEDPQVVDLSRDLNALKIHPNQPNLVNFRSPNSVALKLANFAAIDPNYPGRGLEGGAKGDRDVWHRYAQDEDALAMTAAAIREERGLPGMQHAELGPPRVTRTKVEAQHVEQFWVSAPSRITRVTRREQSLVLAYEEHLASQGHQVMRGKYRPAGSDSALASDLVDETDGVLYEAKGHVRRASVRMAIGQLLDYRRFEPPTTRLAVLLPRRPSEDLIDLILKVPASVVWRTDDGFESLEPQGAISI